MKTIVVGFSRARSKWMVGSTLIAWWMGTDFSHTLFKFKEDIYPDWTINQSTGHGINYMAETSFLKNNMMVKEFTLTISDELYMEILQTCHVNAGVDYGYLQNLGILFVDLVGKIGIKINENPLPEGVNCSEWMFYILEEVYGKWTDKDPDLVEPKDVYDFLVSKNLPISVG